MAYIIGTPLRPKFILNRYKEPWGGSGLNGLRFGALGLCGLVVTLSRVQQDCALLKPLDPKFAASAA